jgi:hypothetical protein
MFIWAFGERGKLSPLTSTRFAGMHPWLETAGMFADDPALEPMLQGIYAARAE